VTMREHLSILHFFLNSVNECRMISEIISCISLHESDHITLRGTANVYREVRTPCISFTQLVLQMVTLRILSDDTRS